MGKYALTHSPKINRSWVFQGAWLIFRSAKISRILEATEVTASTGDEDDDHNEGHAANEELSDGREG